MVTKCPEITAGSGERAIKLFCRVGDMETSHICLGSCQNLLFLAAGESFISVLGAVPRVNESVNCSASKISQI